MSPERWQRIEGILDDVLELPTEDAAAHLDVSCGDDAELRAEVEALLAAEKHSEGILEGSAAELAHDLFNGASSDGSAVEAGIETYAKLEGTKIGPYRILHLLGAGGMGDVWKAHDTRLERTVALKLLPREWSRNAQAKERFLREARTASGLDHSNILNVHDLGTTEDGQLYLVTAYYPGETLQQKLRRGPLPLGLVRKVAVEVARGLERAHEAGIVHRDIKPGNVMVTERGEVKILDFGIARMADHAALTQTGTLPGTPAYMSPEQVAGEPLDARSDLWSLGVMLYECITGRRPFLGDHGLVVMRSITEDPPAPLERPEEDVPEDLRRVVHRALEKDPADRFESAAALLSELHPSSGTATLLLPSPKRRSTPTLTVLTVGMVALLTFLSWWMWRSGSSPTESAAVPGAAPQAQATAGSNELTAPRASIAVLYFDNLMADPELDWLQNGITDMLVTELSQSPEIKVLSTGRLYQILQGLNALDPKTPSFKVIQAVAREAEATAVVRGSFARLGNVLRLTFTLESPADGEILAGDRFEGEGDESLFSLVDQLSATIRDRFEITAPSGAQTAVQDVTTSSLEAWRLYSEAGELQLRSREAEALPLLERAVELDGDFALALMALGRIHKNLDNASLAQEYMGRVVDQAHRLPLDQRFSFSAFHYSTSWSTYGRAIDLFQEALHLDPNQGSWRDNLANLYAYLELYDRAALEFEYLLEHDAAFAGTNQAAADTFTALGQVERGHRLLAEFADQNPDNWLGHLSLAWFLIQDGNLHEVEDHLRRAASLPGNRYVDYVRWRLRVLQQDLDRADDAARAMLTREDPTVRWRGSVSLARNLLYRGRSAEADEQFRLAALDVPDLGAFTALTHAWRAELLLHRGDPAEALEAARQARLQAPESWPEYLGIFYEAQALQLLGKTTEAEALRKELQTRSEKQPNPVEERQLKHLEGRLALARQDVDGALAALHQAEELLPVRGVEIHNYALPDHVPIWFALGEAELAAGRPEAALPWFNRVAESGSEHIMFPVPWVRSFFYLGSIHRALGADETARFHFERFLNLWENGDCDRERVAEARRETDT